MWQAVGLQTCGVPELSPCNQRLPAAPAARLAKQWVRGVRVGSLWLYLLASNGGWNLLLPHCCTASLPGFSHSLLWLLRQDGASAPRLLIVGFSLTLPLPLCQLVLGGRGPHSPVCGFAFSLVMAAASARLPHCCATSLPVTWFGCSMRWLLRRDCCFCPAGPLNCCVRAAARLLPCCGDS